MSVALVLMCIAKVMFLVKNPAPAVSHSVSDMPYGIVLSFGCVAWKSRHTGQYLIVFYISLLMFIPYMHLHTNSLILSVPMSLMCSWFRTVYCRDVGSMILEPFIVIPCIATISFLNGQYNGISFVTSTFVDGHLFILWMGKEIDKCVVNRCICCWSYS